MMKLCRYCKNLYPESDFGVAKTIGSKIYRRQKCRFCYRKTKNLLKSKRRELIEATKKENGCVRCKIEDPRVLEFHHLDTSQKHFSIADYYYSQYGIVKLEQEIAKCVVICANCHRILHAEQRQKTIDDLSAI
jgi:hypothetical protein